MSQSTVSLLAGRNRDNGDGGSVWHCCKKRFFLFHNPALERDYHSFLVSGRQKVLTGISVIIVCFATVLSVLLSLNWSTSPWSGNVTHQNPCGANLSPYYGCKFGAHLSLVVSFACGGILINTPATAKHWNSVSTVVASIVAGGTLPLVFLSSVVGYFELSDCRNMILGNFTPSQINDSRVANATASDMAALLDLTFEISTTARSNSVTLLLGPVYMLAFSMPMKSYVIMVSFVLIFLIFPDVILHGLLYNITSLVLGSLGNEDDVMKGYDLYYDIGHGALQYVPTI